LIAFEIAQFTEVFCGDVLPSLGDDLLHGGVHFPVIEPDAAGFIGLGLAVVQPVTKEAIHLFDTVLVGPIGFHHFVEQGDVEWDDGDGGAGLSDECFIDGDPCFALERGQSDVECALDAF
jgi:hypothetical protein